jgi:hypothetical protein
MRSSGERHQKLIRAITIVGRSTTTVLDLFLLLLKILGSLQGLAFV